MDQNNTGKTFEQVVGQIQSNLIDYYNAIEGLTRGIVEVEQLKDFLEYDINYLNFLYTKQEFIKTNSGLKKNDNRKMDD